MEKKTTMIIVAVVVIVIVAAAAVAVVLSNSDNRQTLTIYVEDGNDGFHTVISAKGDTKIDAATEAFKNANIDYTINKETGWVTTINGKGTVQNEDGTWTYWILYQWDKNVNKWIVSSTTITGIPAEYNTICYFYSAVDANYNPVSYPTYSPIGLSFDDTLMVYGNANEDRTIDDKDKAIISDIINGKKSFSTYPMADANADGKVDNSDLTLVEKIIKRESTTVYVKNMLDAADLADAGDLKLEVAAVDYPLKNVIPINADLIMMMLTLDGKSVMAGYGGSVYGLEKDYLKGITDVKAARTIDENAYRNIKNIDSTISGGVGALILYNVNSVTSKGYADDFIDAGIPMIFVKGSMPDYAASSVVTLGFLFGGDFEKKGTDIADFTKAEYDEIAKKLGDSKLPTSTSLSMGTSLAQSNSQYAKTSRTAGSIPVYLKDGTTSEKITNAEALMKLNPDYLNSYTTKGLKKLTNAEIIKAYECTDFNYITPCNAYKAGHLTYINASLPAMIRVAYAAEALNSTLFDGYGDTTFQKFVDKFMPFLDQLCDDGDFDVSTDCTSMITYADYKAAGGTQ